MRRFLLVFILLFQVNSVLQAQVDVRADNNDTAIRISFILEKSWYLYGKSGQVEAPTLSTTLDGVKLSLLQLTSPSSVMHDPILQQDVPVYKGIVAGEVKINSLPDGVSVIPVVVHGYAADGQTFLPIEKELHLQVRAQTIATRVRIPGMQVTALVSGNNVISTGWWKVMLLGMAGGLLALLTPCVFPMIPVTVSFFGSRSAGKKQAVRAGVLYGAAILLIYLAASVPFHVLSSVRPELLNNISTSAVLNLVFFVIFIFFALSLFGVFELRLPAALANGSDSRSGIGSTAGMFFLALTLVIVSFSCTGPILGSLLVGSLSGSNSAWLLTAGMAGFGIALGLPFALFAIFPHWLSRIPKSGSWLAAVKISLGFVELALAFKFLSNADLVLHWGLLKRELFLGIWLLIAVGWLLYLLDIRGWIREGRWRVGKGAGVMSLLLLVVIGYLGWGMANKPVSLLSGFAPPSFYSLSGKPTQKLEADVINDYEKALSLAKAAHKKILIDFTGWACVNCRKMEEQVWTDPRVMQLIRNEYILVSLYVDDKTELPAEKQLFGYVTRDHAQKDIRTLGDLYAAMEAENLGQVSQPLYAVIDANEQLLFPPVGYTPDAGKFADWLSGRKP